VQKATKSERQMLREIAWLWLPQKACALCHKPLLVRPEGMTFGHRRHSPIPVKFTVHHYDHNRENNHDANLFVVHSTCHRTYHAEVNRGDRSKPLSTDR
jgi:hypothetical protein